MRITKVELDSIKSYRHATITLRGGTTAIRGSNGAGKSTLVEAIGFALFDSLTYKQAQFVREGERTGQVTVSFFSAFDDREYQAVRRCGNASDWYIYDPELRERVVEQRTDVLAFLRQHLRIEGEVPLNTLFNDALGVAQGTFTADFLMTSTNRKKKFDALLQVEDYRKASDRLLETRNYIQEQRHEQQRRVDALEHETGQLEGWHTQLTEQRRQAEALATHLVALQAEAERIETQREQLRGYEAEATRTQRLMEVAGATHEAALERLRTAEARTQEAQAALRVCEETRPDHEAYQRTEALLTSARQRQRQREALREQRADVAKRLEGATRDLTHASERLARAKDAERAALDLVAAVEQQHTLEGVRADAQRRVSLHDETQAAHDRTTRDEAQLAEEIARTQRALAALDALRPEAAELADRREHLERLQAAAAIQAQQQQRLAANRTEQVQTQTQREKSATQEAKHRENVRKLIEQQALIVQLPALEQEHDALERDLRQREAEQEHNRRSRQQSGQGLCPFLQEACLNIQKRGENSLVSYFDRRIAVGERELAPVRVRRDEAQAAVERLRTVKSYVDRLETYQEQLRSAQEALALQDAQLLRLTAEQTALEAALAATPNPRALAEARASHQRASEADRRLATYETIQGQLRQAQERRETLAAEQQTRRETLAALAGAAADLRATEEALHALADPRSRFAAVKQIADERPQHEARVASTSAAAEHLTAALAQSEEQLRPYANLDAELHALDAELQRAQPGHARYLHHEQAAGRLAEHETAQRAAAGAVTEAQAAYVTASANYAAASARFDPTEYAAVRQRAADVAAQRGEQTQKLRQTQEAVRWLEGEIARVAALMDELRAAREERQTLDDLEHMVQQFRETIREAGPYIMRALLRTISVEANRIFGEIMGDRAAQLAWQDDYEIVLLRDGRERSFAQLSGGEQMSAALAVRLALLRNLSRLDIAFFDEPTQNMDDERRSNLAEQIRRVRGFDQLLVISHDDTFEQGLDNVIHVEKRGGETLLVEDEALILA